MCHDESLVKRVKGHFVTRLLSANYEKHPVQLDKLLEAGKSYHLQRKCRTPLELRLSRKRACASILSRPFEGNTNHRTTWVLDFPSRPLPPLIERVSENLKIFWSMATLVLVFYAMRNCQDFDVIIQSFFAMSITLSFDSSLLWIVDPWTLRVKLTCSLHITLVQHCFTSRSYTYCDERENTLSRLFRVVFRIGKVTITHPQNVTQTCTD